MFSVGIVTKANITMSRIIIEFIVNNVAGMHDLLLNVHECIAASSGSRCAVYRSINPGLTAHSMYRVQYVQIFFTRFGHSLCVETGICNRRGRGRLPLGECVCVYVAMYKLRSLLRIVLEQTILVTQ